MLAEAGSSRYEENNQEEHTQEKVQDAVDNYLRESTSDNLKQISMLEKKMVEEYLIKLIRRDTASTINSYNEARAIRDNILTYKSVYSEAFAETSEDIQVIYDLFLNLVSQYFQRIKINQKYPFEITDVNSCNWKEFYITQRLEKSYSDNIMGVIQKEIDSYAKETTSDWVAYNVNYDSIWGALPGDEVCVIHADELNPFPEAGVYKLLCFNSDSTISLRDSKGFVEDAPIVHLISDEQQLYADYESYKAMTAESDRLKEEIEAWRLAYLTQSSSAMEDETQPQMTNTVANNSVSTSIVALDYINGTTGDIIEALGADIVYAGGYSGSNRFYHSNYPDVYFGYIPNDWSTTEITGNEEISTIWLTGSAKITPNLSANMSKAELDAVAWSTSDVSSVKTESYYSEIVGETVFQYRIETSMGTIIYEWYLDSGSGVNGAASDVFVIPARTTQKSSTQTSTSSSFNQIGYVVESSGGLKIRSGPSTSYEEVGRLAPLESVTIFEIQNNGNRDWGRIDRGWVCMDYIIIGEVPKSSNEASYNKVLDQYRTAQNTNFQNCGQYVGESFSYLSSWGAKWDVYYSQIDLNGDGITELLIGGKDTSSEYASIEKMDLFTFSNGIPQRLVETGSLGHRAHLYIYPDGTFATSGSGGASTHMTVFYKLYAYSSSASVMHGYGTDMGEPYYYGSDGDPYPISEDEYNALPFASELTEMHINWIRLQ